MSMLLPRYHDFSSLFRIADEFDRASRHGTSQHSLSRPTRSFSPRFDVKENKEAYQLQGELPGVERSNINIEWSDDNTLIISGHTEQVTETASSAPASEAEHAGYQKPTIEDEPVAAPTATSAVTKSEASKTLANNQFRSRYWASERSYGSFHRTFQFPGHVSHDGVKAGLKDGILELIVPKAKAPEPRKIMIEGF